MVAKTASKISINSMKLMGLPRSSVKRGSSRSSVFPVAWQKLGQYFSSGWCVPRIHPPSLQQKALRSGEWWERVVVALGSVERRLVNRRLAYWIHRAVL